MAKTALIWGASGGIGLALVKLLTTKDWQVIAVARKTESLTSFTPHVYEADFSYPGSLQSITAQMIQEGFQVDWWVYAAGDIMVAPVTKMDFEQWQRILSANLSGAYWALHCSVELLNPEASIYFLGAVNERIRLPGLSAYAAAKAGLEAFADVTRKELKRSVVVVRPAAVNTPLWKKVPFKMPSNAVAPEVIAAKMWEAYQANYSGYLDLP
ncbi:SDR family NAD(P)-dependent oxidoreductase [uncultured Thermanaerothrix sp.]|uniref:SDR family NAD(P)-dependent oxidoreductase n=1 Tax=uncultured Thermanaerothrix sp. TaxID=1195149 RepID=UPI00260D01E4|nr:SDR family NAD(P)-dependent oxidoreductase [uncultured Thermanaerothrix sp.]